VAAHLRLRILRLQQDPCHPWQSLSPPLTIPPAETRCSVWQTKVHVSESVLRGLAASASQRWAIKPRKQCISSTHHFKQPSSMVLQELPTGGRVARSVTGAVASWHHSKTLFHSSSWQSSTAACWKHDGRPNAHSRTRALLSQTAEPYLEYK
jgi:hypothetical protein